MSFLHLSEHKTVCIILLLAFSITCTQAANLTIDGGTKTLGGSHIYDHVKIVNGGILYVQDGENLKLNASSIKIDSSSSINGIGAGYTGGSSNANQCDTGSSQGNGPGGGAGDSQSGEGGSYGGLGGKGEGGNCAKATTYGNKTEALKMGSGGGGETQCGGHDGGGNIQLYVDDKLEINGTVTVKGEKAITCNSDDTGGAGSGGGVHIDTRKILGTGSIIARGGDNGQCSDYGGGAGGGGRIAILHSDNSSWTGSLNVNGGEAYSCGGGEDGTAGTIYWEKVERSICDKRGNKNQCVLNTEKTLQNRIYNFSSILKAKSSALLTTDSGRANLKVKNSSKISGTWQGIFTIKSRNPVITPGARFRPVGGSINIEKIN